MKWFLILLVLLQSFALMSCKSDEEVNKETFSEVKDDWIDPHNMVDDYHAVWIKKNGDNTHPTGKNILGDMSNKDSEDAMTRAFSNIREELKNCERKLEAISSSSSKDEVKKLTSCDTPYFKQLVRVLHESASNTKPYTQINLSAEHRETLKKFLNDEANIHDVITILLDNITNKTISDSFMDKYTVFISSFLNTETIVLLICLVLLITTVIVFEMTTRLTARQQFIYLCVTSFIVSIPWEWYRLYKIEFAKKQSVTMERLQKHCHTDHELGPIESVILWWKSSFSTVDSSCAKYQEAILVDAVWEVSPAMAISVTLTRFFVQPLEHIADATGKSFRALFQHLPIQWQPLMFLACLFVIIICLILVCGFHIKTPFLKFGVGTEPALNNEQLLRIENQVQELQHNAENQNVPAIENVRENDQRMQAVLDMQRALNQRSEQQEIQLREIRNNLQDIRRRECRQAEAVEHPDWEVVEGTCVPEGQVAGRLRRPVQASELNPTENAGPAE